MSVGLETDIRTTGQANQPELGASPFAVAQSSASASPSNDPDGAFGALFDSSATILVLDDEQSVLEIMVEMLEQLGYEVLSANGLVQALEVTEGNPPVDLLLLDVVMPDANGPVVAAQIRQRYPDITVRFMSGYTADVVVGHNVEADKVLGKPFTLQGPADIDSSALGGR